MANPEPVDETPAPEVEVRGGDRPEDYVPEEDDALLPWNVYAIEEASDD